MVNNIHRGRGVILGVSLLFIVLTITTGLIHRSQTQQSEVLSANTTASPTDVLVESEIITGNEIFDSPAPTQPSESIESGNDTQGASLNGSGLTPKVTGDDAATIGGLDEEIKSSGTANGIPPSPTPTGMMIHALGKVVVGGKVVEYYTDFPSDGGAMSGQGSGDCTGSLRGTFFADTQVAGGSMDGICRINGEEIEVRGTYAGKIYLTVGSGYGTWEGEDDNSRKAEGEWEVAFPAMK